jgi:hypothetical protein
VANDTNGSTRVGGYYDIFMRDMAVGTTTLISINSTGTGSGNDNSYLAEDSFNATPDNAVQSDWRNHVDEGIFGANKANNTAASASTLTLTVPTLVANTPVQGTFTAPGQDIY